MSLLQRVVLADALLVFVAVALLVLSPVTVSRTATVAEVGVLLVGAAVLLTVTTAMTRRALVPLQSLAALMGRADPAAGSHPPIPEDVRGGTQEVADLARAFDAMLTRLEDERRRSTRLAIDAQEAERERLARELHDEVAQTLTAITLQLQGAEALGPQDLAVRLAGVREAAHEGSDAVREIMRGLRPEALEDFGLRAAVVALASSFADRTGVRVRRALDEQLPAVAPEVELVVYRVAQEALANVARHAGASEVRVALETHGGELVLEVRDDGAGLGGRPEGSGRQGMRERTLLVGGRLTVGDAQDGGTLVSLRVPLPRTDGAS